MVGVNGAGKTTTIGKLARRFKDSGLEVMLAAGDTFRAAAVEQLTLWAERLDIPIVKQATGADPAAVAFDDPLADREARYRQRYADLAVNPQVREVFHGFIKKKIRNVILGESRRPDNRAFNEVRPVSNEESMLPRTQSR